MTRQVFPPGFPPSKVAKVGDEFDAKMVYLSMDEANCKVGVMKAILTHYLRTR